MPAQREKKDRTLPLTLECTLNLHKRLFGLYIIQTFNVINRRSFKTRAPRAIKAIREYASKVTGTSDVRIDTDLNKNLWHKGIKNPPNRIRLLIQRKKNDDEEAEEKV